MINEIIQGITTSLDAQFNADSNVYEIYTEEIKQGLQEPCFFVQCISPKTSLFLGNRYKSSNQFCIQYFPSTQKKQAECNNIIEALNSCLEYITVSGNLMRGTGMHSEFTDNVLSYFVNYDFFAYKVVTQEPYMDKIQVHEDIKGW